MTFVCAGCNQWLSVDDRSGEPGTCRSCFERLDRERLERLRDELRDVVEAFLDRGTTDDIGRALEAIRNVQAGRAEPFRRRRRRPRAAAVERRGDHARQAGHAPVPGRLGCSSRTPLLIRTAGRIR